MKVLVLGATGNLGRVLAKTLLSQGHDLTVLVRSPNRLDPTLAAGARVIAADLAALDVAGLAAQMAGQDAVVNCAGNVKDGAGFSALVERIVAAAESLPEDARPVLWLLAGAAVLDLDRRGRRGIDLPKVGTMYAPHRVNLMRLMRSPLDWRLLCPGPMVETPVLGPGRLRVSVDTLPAPLPGLAGAVPKFVLLALFARKVPEMIVSYDDAAGVIVANLSPGGPMSRKRIGIALPPGMRGRKDTVTAPAT